MDCKEKGLSRDANRALNLAINDSIPAHDEVNETELEAQSESVKGKDMYSETSDDDDYDDDDEYGSEQGVYRVMCREGLIEE